MKTRENELHEPKVEILRSGNVTTTLAVLCSACGNQILTTTGNCPNCGARLKEVSE